jgi:hypothetical protein
MVRKNLLTREQLAQSLKQFANNPEYEKRGREEIHNIASGSYIKYIIASSASKTGPPMYKMGSGFFKNNYFDGTKNRHIMWIFNKHIGKNVRIYHENIRFVFVKTKMEKKITDRLEVIEDAIQSSVESERDHTLTIMKALLTVGKAAKDH